MRDDYSFVEHSRINHPIMNEWRQQQIVFNNNKEKDIMKAMQASLLFLPICLLLISIPACGDNIMPLSKARPADPLQKMERTSFQTGSPWDPMLDIRSDVVMCYGLPVTPADIARIEGWRNQGYRVHTMTGVAWGGYQDYLYGRFDGINHVDEAQTDSQGNKISHGGDIYYMSPSISFGKYLCSGVQHALDAGVEAIDLEEPEFWVRGGWSEGFKREWEAYYHVPWADPNSSVEAQYRSSLLKYYLYRRALGQVFDYVKAYNKEHGTHVKCYVATHSLINYSSWGIVSPESSLMEVGADGYIAQVWTGTARTPNMYEGRLRERTFETAFLEYGAMMNIVKASGGSVWFLNDPVEDDPNHSWKDYKSNWESTLTASLLWPQVWRYEVMPWPERIFHGSYPVKDSSERKPGEAVAKEPIPPEYATELMTVINSLNNMRQSDIKWDCGTQGIGVVVSDSMMFQRGGPTPSDSHLGSFYALALPLLKRGIPVEPVQLETASIKGALSKNRILLMTYEGMKPMTSKHSLAIADWVKAGGSLVFVDNDTDPYNHIRSWWNAAPNNYANPREALFAQMNTPLNAASGTYRIGKGTLIYEKTSPAALTYKPDGADQIRDLVRKACKDANLSYKETGYIILQRGPYIVASGLDESLQQAPHKITGHFIDLFDAKLPVLKSVSLIPGSRYLLMDINQKGIKAPSILAAACKTLGARRLPDGGFRFYAEGPDKITASVRLLLSSSPANVMVDGHELAKESQTWDASTHTLLLHFPNSASGHWIDIR
jgi:hypothetical protein